jgi:CheY-like chemotaxis protein/two-component sensor histidine kinase
MTANLDMALEEIREFGGGSAPALMRELEDLVMAAREGAERVHKIVRGLKTFSQNEEERRVVLELGPVLELSINMVFNEIRHRARLVKDFGLTPPVEADGARLAQVFVNLLVNAAQALPRNDLRNNEIHVATSTDAAGRAVIEIRDTGPGIPRAVIERIFDPFYTTKPVGIGTGLGLSICHNIVSALGGDISVKSEEGRGASFRVVLPAASHREQALEIVTARREHTPQPSADSLPSGGAEASLGAPASAPRRALVLIVDDEPAVGLMLARALREHDVTIVVGAKEALELITSGRDFDVILSDLMMPRMSGMDFHAELLQRFPTLVERMVFVTGGAFSAAARAFLLRIPNQRIEKPLDVKRLRTLVRNLVN